MISLVTNLSPVAPIAQPAAGKQAGDEFVLSLAAFLDAIQPAVAGDAAGQGDAGSGKDLPGARLPAEDKDSVDPALMTIPQVLVQPQPLPQFAWQVPVEAVTAPAPITTIGGATGALPVASNDAAPAASPIALATALLQPVPAEAPPMPIAAQAVAPMAIETPVAAKPTVEAKPVPAAQALPAPAPVIAGTTAPAQQVFAAAIHAAANDGVVEKPAREIPAEPLAPAIAAPTTTTSIAAPAVATAQNAMLDMRHERWPHSMIDHIEGLRDAADAVSTRIRLIPDALGSIDVAVRKDGDTMHVQFQAEQAQTRAMLADAQPKLAEIAQERGLKLGDATVTVGTGGGASGMAMNNGQAQQQAAQQQQGGRPAPASPVPALVAADATDADADTRIA